MKYKCVGGPLDGKYQELSNKHEFITVPAEKVPASWSGSELDISHLKTETHHRVEITVEYQQITILSPVDTEPVDIIRMLIDGYQGIIKQ